VDVGEPRSSGELEAVVGYKGGFEGRWTRVRGLDGGVEKGRLGVLDGIAYGSRDGRRRTKTAGWPHGL
jgi:hypothetical protein